MAENGFATAPITPASHNWPGFGLGHGWNGFGRRATAPEIHSHRNHSVHSDGSSGGSSGTRYALPAERRGKRGSQPDWRRAGISGRQDLELLRLGEGGYRTGDLDVFDFGFATQRQMSLSSPAPQERGSADGSALSGRTALESASDGGSAMKFGEALGGEKYREKEMGTETQGSESGTADEEGDGELSQVATLFEDKPESRGAAWTE
jgi:hypothetical protein